MSADPTTHDLTSQFTEVADRFHRNALLGHALEGSAADTRHTIGRRRVDLDAEISRGLAKLMSMSSATADAWVVLVQQFVQLRRGRIDPGAWFAHVRTQLPLNRVEPDVQVAFFELAADV